MIHVDVWPKAVQYCKAITLQLNINKFKYKNVFGDHITRSDVHCMPKEDLTGNWWCQLSLISDSLTLSLNEKSKLTNSNKRLWFSVIASYSPGLCLLLGGIVRKLWNWGCFQNCTIMSPAQGFCSWCWRILFSGPLGSKLSLLSILWFYHVHKSFYFRFLIWFSYSFDQTAKSLYDWLQTLLCFDFSDAHSCICFHVYISEYFSVSMYTLPYFLTIWILVFTISIFLWTSLFFWFSFWYTA